MPLPTSDSPENTDQLNQFVSLMQALSVMFIDEKFVVPPALSTCIKLSAEGEEIWHEGFQTDGETVERSDYKFACLLELAASGILIDLSKTSFEEIEPAISSLLQDKSLKIPWIHGRDIYDCYSENVENPEEYLSTDQTKLLLDKTEQGVVQAGNLIAGPLGLTRAQTYRLVRSAQKVAISHCSDTGCSNIHKTVLSSGSHAIVDIQSYINEISDLSFQSSLIEDFYSTFPSTYLNDASLEALPYLLGTGFSTIELQKIVYDVGARYQAQFRTLFSQSIRRKQLAKMSMDKIVPELKKSECLQLLLMADDATIITSLEKAIANEDIRIPESEIRSVSDQSDRVFGVSVQCSSHGVRSRATKGTLAVLRLKSRIAKIYSQLNQDSLLEWHLRAVAGAGALEKLDNYLYSVSPYQAIKTLIFDQPEHLSLMLDSLGPSYNWQPSSESLETQLIEKIAWKLGFDVKKFPNHGQTFSRRNKTFLQTARNDGTKTEANREHVRSAGANFFVSLEEILTNTLCFSTWLLLSDHFLQTRFRYNQAEALNLMASALNTCAENIEQIVYDPTGKNTLYSLTKGFELLAELCRNSLKRESKYLRPKHELPHFFSEPNASGIDSFPFLHNQFFMDLRGSELDHTLTLLTNIHTKLESAQVCSVRNRIDHKRDDFPKLEEIEKVCDETSELFALLEATGLHPTLFYLSSDIQDMFGRRRLRYADYLTREVDIQRTHQLDWCGLPEPDVPLLIVPKLHFGDSAELVRFQLWESSSYCSMWKDYPPRKLTTKKIPYTEPTNDATHSH